MRCALLAALIAMACKSPSADEQIAANRATLEKNLATKIDCSRPLLRAAPADVTAVDLDTRFELPAVCDEVRAAFNAEGQKGPFMELPFKVLEAPKAAECMDHVTRIVRSAVSLPAVCAGEYREPASSEQTTALFVAYIIALHAREVAKTSPAQGLTLALDGLRFFQDGTRGGTLIQAMVSGAASRLLIDRAALPILEAPPPLDADTAHSLDNPTVRAAAMRDVDALLATEPAFHDTLLAEANWIGKERGMKRLVGSTRKEGAEALAASVAFHEVWGRACPVTATLKACWSTLQSATTPTEAQDRAVDLPPYVSKWSQTIVRMSVLRFKLEIGTRGCPSALTEASWKAILAPAKLGDTLRVDRTATGFTLRPPSWMERDTATWLIPCPSPPT